MKLIYFKKNIYVVKISRKVRFSSSVIEGKKLFSIATKIEKKKKKLLILQLLFCFFFVSCRLTQTTMIYTRQQKNLEM